MVQGPKKPVNKGFFTKKGIDFPGESTYNVYIK